MSHSIRFLGAAIVVWAAVRAISLGLVPGTEALAFDAQAAQSSEPRLPPIQPTLLPPIAPVAPTYPSQAMGYGPQGAYPPQGYYPPPGYYQPYAPYPVYVAIPAAAPRNVTPQVVYLPAPSADPRDIHIYGSGYTGTQSAPRQLAAAEPVPPLRSTPSFGPVNLPRGLDQLSLSSWAMMRDQAGSQSLANGGTLGGSQAGARLLWNFTPRFAASLRASAPINSQRGGEAALGVRYQPFTSWPVALTLERRKALGDYVGRNAFAAFAEGGVYGRPMPWGTTLDGYFQAGIVDFNNPDWFVDGQAAVTRPVWRNLSAGLGMWGGAQPGLTRFDAGPRVSLRVGTRMRMHLDYRLNLAGNAEPGSGAVTTIAGDF